MPRVPGIRQTENDVSAARHRGIYPLTFAFGLVDISHRTAREPGIFHSETAKPRLRPPPTPIFTSYKVQVVICLVLHQARRLRTEDTYI